MERKPGHPTRYSASRRRPSSDALHIRTSIAAGQAYGEHLAILETERKNQAAKDFSSELSKASVGHGDIPKAVNMGHRAGLTRLETLEQIRMSLLSNKLRQGKTKAAQRYSIAIQLDFVNSEIAREESRLSKPE
jgi:hypothetical protein